MADAPPHHATSDRTARRHIPALDGLRGVAILMVMSVHLGGGRQSQYLAVRLVADSLRLGWAGVVLFFVLSGFLITGILWDSFQQPAWWKRFYAKRLLRIFPVYYLALAYATVVLLFAAPAALRAVLTYALFLQNFACFDPITQSIPQHILSLDSFWSLAVEEQFYLLWPIVLFACRRHRNSAMHLSLAGIAGSLIVRLILLQQHASVSWTYRSLPARGGELLLGAWIALAVRGDTSAQQRLFRHVPVVFLTSFAALVALTLATRASFETTEPLWLGPGLLALTLFMGCILIYSLRPTFVERMLRSNLLRWFGTISYGLYVLEGLVTVPCHRLVDHFAVRFNRQHMHSEQTQLFESLAAFAGATFLAWPSYNTYERYFLRRKTHLRI